MVEVRRRRLAFPLEAREPFRIAGHFHRQDFKRYVAAELGVGGAIHFAHPACTKGGVDPIVGKRPADHFLVEASLYENWACRRQPGGKQRRFYTRSTG